YQEALAIAEPVLADYVRLYGDSSQVVEEPRRNLGEIFGNLGRLRDAEAQYRKNVELCRAREGANSLWTQWHRVILDECLIAQGRSEEALQELDSVLQKVDAPKSPHDDQGLLWARAHLFRGSSLLSMGDARRAEPDLVEAE